MDRRCRNSIHSAGARLRWATLHACAFQAAGYGPPTVGWNNIVQNWWETPASETVAISLVNVFEWRHLGPIYRGAWEVVQG
jgi:hypothetical protein